MSTTVDVTTWSLEQTSPGDLAPSPVPGAGSGVRIERAGVPSPEFSRFLYTAVGGDWMWTDRLAWTYERWRHWLEREEPGAVETWVLYVDGTPAGYAELETQPDAVVEIAQFGLLPAFIGRGLGGHLLSVGTARAWDLADRVPGREPTRRVGVRTCSLDGEAALANYRARGFRVSGTRVRTEPARPVVGPWPGAR